MLFPKFDIAVDNEKTFVFGFIAEPIWTPLFEPDPSNPTYVAAV